MYNSKIPEISLRNGFRVSRSSIRGTLEVADATELRTTFTWIAIRSKFTMYLLNKVYIGNVQLVRPFIRKFPEKRR